MINNATLCTSNPDLLLKVSVMTNQIERNFATFTVKDLTEKRLMFHGKKGG